MFGFSFAPRGYALCNGQILAISQNTALFALVGTSYGGNGTSNYGLPNLQCAHPMHQGNGLGLTPRALGEFGGVPNVTILTTEMPAHTHLVRTLAGTPTTPAPSRTASNSLPVPSPAKPYGTATPTALMATDSVGVNSGGNLPHNNLSPYLAVTFCIALQGVFPARN
jgi:microcystin-dependent protein